jgi:hypothetical protein
MTDAALVFVHSPLVGPLTWRAVADRFNAEGWQAAVPDVSVAMAGGGPYRPAIEARARQAAAELDSPVVLIGHSGAGPLLPGIAAASPVPVRGLLYVDAGLPYPGRSWFQTAPRDLVDHLAAMAADGWLPPWHEWFPPESLAGLLPDARLRDRFTAELRPLPLSYFQEAMPSVTWSGPAGYLLLSEAYRDDATRAGEQHLLVVELPSDHLAMITTPDAVTAALRDLLAALPSGSR